MAGLAHVNCLPDLKDGAYNMLESRSQYKEGNNRPSFGNLKSLVNSKSQNKTRNKVTPKIIRHSGQPKCKNRCRGKVMIKGGNPPAV